MDVDLHLWKSNMHSLEFFIWKFQLIEDDLILKNTAYQGALSLQVFFGSIPSIYDA